MAAGTTAAVIVVVALLLLFVVVSLWKSVLVVKEKENIIIERLGAFKAQLTPGVHFIIPWIDRPKNYSVRYYISNAVGNTELVSRTEFRIHTQNEVLDFPQQAVITRDNAMIYLDAVVNYKIVNPKLMIYSTQNLPRMLSKLVQAQIRNVAGTLDVDQIIEDTAAMDRVAGEVAVPAARWGALIEFIKIQKVEAGSLASVLAKKKNADLQNQEVVIHAKAVKQTAIIEAEGQRDKMVREAEGEAQQIRSRARGDAKAITNAATAEAQSIREVARAIRRAGESPTRYLLALKYIEALRRITSQPGTEVRFLPRETAFLQTVKDLGANTVISRRQ